MFDKSGRTTCVYYLLYIVLYPSLNNYIVAYFRTLLVYRTVCYCGYTVAALASRGEGTGGYVIKNHLMTNCCSVGGAQSRNLSKRISSDVIVLIMT